MLKFNMKYFSYEENEMEIRFELQANTWRWYLSLILV